MADTSIRVFIDGRGVDVPHGAQAIDAVRAANADFATEVERGERVITDSRGLPTAADTHVSAGSIFRVVLNRHRDISDDDESTGG